jgi:hypothetical protein
LDEEKGHDAPPTTRVIRWAYFAHHEDNRGGGSAHSIQVASGETEANRPVWGERLHRTERGSVDGHGCLVALLHIGDRNAVLRRVALGVASGWRNGFLFCSTQQPCGMESRAACEVRAGTAAATARQVRNEDE